ncbi:MAG TPA: hypothetical protein VEI03_13245 [Stellaceae bacterium]|nr:hypothetical protein [Stellaceae bacterium]
MKAASLTASLLAPKANAAPEMAQAAVDMGGNVQFLPKPPRAGKGEGMVRVSLRMSTERHLRLRLAAAHLGRSNHALMLAAVDHYIDHILPPLLAGHCACLEQGRMPAGGCSALGFGRTRPDRPQ